MVLRTYARMDSGEIDRLDQENALIELEDIVARVREMAAVNYDLDVGEAEEWLDIWSAANNSEAKELLAALRAAIERAGPALNRRT